MLNFPLHKNEIIGGMRFTEELLFLHSLGSCYLVMFLCNTFYFHLIIALKSHAHTHSMICVID